MSKILDICGIEPSKVIITIPRFYMRNSLSRRCRRPFQSIRIGVDGGVSACPRAINPNLNNGHVLNDNDVFNNEHFQKIRSDLLDGKLPLRYECMYCEKRC